jgi:hypothetical protein
LADDSPGCSAVIVMVYLAKAMILPVVAGRLHPHTRECRYADVTVVQA